MLNARLPAYQRGVSKVVLLLSVTIVLLLAAGTTLALYFGGVFGNRPAVVAAPGEVAPPPLAPAVYIPMEPPLVANIDRNGRIGFLQVNIQLMARNPKVKEAVDQHMPVIRNNLLMLLSSKDYQALSSVEGKQELRQQALDEVNKILEAQMATGRIEDLYFTGFVVQ